MHSPSDCYGRARALHRLAMTKIRWIAAAAALSLAACQAGTSNQQQEGAAAEQGADKLARVDMKVDTSYLSAEERQVVNLLMQAADLMNPIYLRQVSADNPRLREEIAKKGGVYLGDVLRYAPGVMASYTPKGRVFTMRSTATGDRCLPTYFLDGHRWFALDGSPILELERFMNLNDLAAVEVYRSGAGLPMQFDTGSGCGSVVFWTK